MYIRQGVALVLFVLLSGVATTIAQSPDPIVPFTGTWEFTLNDEQNNCPADLPLAAAWVPRSGSQHALSFTSLDTLPYDLHMLVAPEAINTEPEAFTITVDEYNQYEIVPNIMTQPFVYRYAVLDEQYIVLEYTQTLALSDCVLTATYSLEFVSSDVDTTTAFNGSFPVNADVNLWTLAGDANTPTFVANDPAAPDSAICGADQSQGETWYFVADESFIRVVNAGYGELFSYDLRITPSNISGTYSSAADIELVVGNGIILHYTFDYVPTEEWTRFSVRLDETAGWIDPDGALPTDDATLFRQIVQDITQVMIRGEYLVESNSACLANVQIGSAASEDEATRPSEDLRGLVGGDVDLRSGTYALEVTHVTGSCAASIPVGTAQTQHIEFSVMGQGAFIIMIAEGNINAVTFTLDTDSGTYRTENDEMSGILTVLGAAEFTITQTDDNCSLTAFALMP